MEQQIAPDTVLSWRKRGHQTPFIANTTQALDRLEDARRYLDELTKVAEQEDWRRLSTWRRIRYRSRIDPLELSYALIDVRRMIGDAASGIRMTERMRAEEGG